MSASSKTNRIDLRVNIDREARNFYLKYGFVSLKDAKSSLILPIATIVASRR